MKRSVPALRAAVPPGTSTVVESQFTEFCQTLQRHETSIGDLSVVNRSYSRFESAPTCARPTSVNPELRS